ncbi:MAG TPA: tetratricopeptide repeat protein [Gemmataceae bacterium]
MKRLLTGVLVAASLPALAAAEDPENPLAEARTRWLRGNYEEARSLYEKHLADKRLRPAAAAGIARTWQAVGEHDKALTVLDGLLQQDETKDHPDLLALRAELRYQRGRWDDALKSADAAVRKQPEQFLARWVRAQVYRDRGEIDKADAEMRWTVRAYTRHNFNDDPIKDPDQLLVIGQAGAENARWHRLSDQFSFILNEVYADALKLDPDLWQAEYLAGMMLLEKYNRPDALDAFDKALKINPRAADALVGKALAALQRLELKDAETFAEQALKVNPNHTAALRLKADILLTAGGLKAALALLEKARAVNPREEATLARVAACHLLNRDQAGLGAVVEEVEKFDARPGVFYFELGELLSDLRLFTAAEQYYEKARALRPNLLGPGSSLGMLYLRLGDEPKAKEVLAEAFRTDPFNVRVANSLKVLRHLEKYETLRTEHFDLRYDPANDSDLADFLAEYLEEVYAKLAKEYGYAPKERILVEVFNSHEYFSGRTIALPDLHTIGACTGKVVTMASPYGKGVPRKFNWGRVVRHELTHVFNLAQTDFRVPHWFTEGLAVRNEGFARPAGWGLLLAERVRSGDLLDLDTIQLAFVRPRTHEEWTLAYCQSELYVEYLVREFGPEVIGKLLNVFAEGLTSAEALRRVCGVEQPEFEKGYRAFLKEVAAPHLGAASAAPLRTLAELEAARRDSPDDLDLASELAYQYMRRRRTKEAAELADTVLGRSPGHALATVVKARLLAEKGEAEEARTLLEEALEKSPTSPRLLRELAQRCVEDRELAKAAELLERGRKHAPHAAPWAEELARIYARIDRKPELIAVLKELARADAEDLDARLKLAELALEAGMPEEAEAAAREALQIDLRDAKVRELLLKTLEEQGKGAEAQRLRKRFEGVRGRSAVDRPRILIK